MISVHHPKSAIKQIHIFVYEYNVNICRRETNSVDRFVHPSLPGVDQSYSLALPVSFLEHLFQLSSLIKRNCYRKGSFCVIYRMFRENCVFVQ